MNSNYLKYVLIGIVILFLVQNVNAESYSYACCANVTTSNGTSIIDFENASLWTAASSNITATTENTISRDGKSVNFTATNSSFARETYTISQTNMANKLIDFWMYLPNTSKFTTIELFLSNQSTLSNYHFKAFSASALHNGWNFISINTTSFTAGGTGTSNLSDVIRVRFTLTLSTNGNPGTVYIDDMRINAIRKAKFIFSFDDFNTNVTSKAYPILEANNQRGAVAVITDNIGTTDSYMTYATLSDIATLYSSDWDVISHTKTHP